MLKYLSFLLSLTALLATIWIVIPAPAYNIWLLSVATSEWSLWFGAAALAAIFCCVYLLIFGEGGKLQIFSLVISSAAFCISLYPFFSVIRLANELNVSLSIVEYFSGSKSENSAENFTTRTFTAVDGKNLQLDIYLPQVKNENNGASVIVVHGGSWNGGKRDDFPIWNKWLAANGFTVFDIDYRLAPQPNYQTATGDVKCATIWVKEHAAEFNISPDRIALFGRSAGAQLALLAAYSAENPQLAPTCPANSQTEQIRAVVSFYAPTDLFWGYNNPANKYVINGAQTLADFIGGNPNESDEIRERFRLASPTNHISPNAPPTLLIHGGQDQLVRAENMKFLDAKLNEADIPHQTIFIPYAQHGFDYNFHGFGSQIVKPAMLDFLRTHTAER